MAIEAAMKAGLRGESSRERLLRVVDAIAPPERPGMRVPLATAVETYLAQPQVEIARQTAVHIRGHVGKFVAWCAEHYPRVEYLDQVSRAIAHEYADQLRGQAITGKTYNNHKGSLGTVWATLQYRAGLSEIVWHTVPTASRKDSRQRRAFTEAELTRILDAADGEWEGVCLFALYTGLRQGDIVRLQWDQVEGDTLVIVPNKTTRHKLQAMIPLHAKVREWVADRKRSSAWLFPEVRERHGKKKAWADFATILEKARVKGDLEIVDFHSFRHTWRTRFAAAGGSPEDAKKVAGWGTDQMAAHYNHDLSRARAAIEAMA